MISRRDLMTRGLLAAPALLSLTTLGRAADAGEAQEKLESLEREHGGRLGVCVLDVSTGRRVEHRARESFPICSTYKVLAAAYVLKRVDRGEDSLDRRVVYSRDDLVSYSPVTEKHVGDPGMTLGEICEAAVTLSDNTAGNLLFDSFGGPAGLTAFLRALGDDVTRLDRRETELNEAKPGDPRDTTTPAAMADNIRELVLGDALSEASRDRLAKWMIANRTGEKRLRAGVPKGWRVGDKTGSGHDAQTHDIAVIWPPDRGPIVVTAYYAGSPAPDTERERVLSEVARLAVGA